MPLAPRPPILTFFLLTALLATSLSVTVLATPASAHGSTQEPPSRVHACRFGHQSNPMCADAWAANPQALYDWMEVNIGEANGRHRELIPDGELCSAGRSKYGAFDEPGAWPLTDLRPNAAGQVELVYENTAPHSTLYYRVYITKEGFDARTDRLAWSDLELAHDTGALNRSPSTRIQATLPARNIPAILYIVWQRSDSPEAFYACSDVTVGNGSTPPPTTQPSTPPPTTQPPTTQSPATVPPTSRPPNTVAPPTTQPDNTVAPATTAPATPTTTIPRPSGQRPVVNFVGVADGDTVGTHVAYGGIHVSAYDPDVGANDGDGIVWVMLVVRDVDTGRWLTARREFWSTYDWGLRLRGGRSYELSAYAISWDRQGPRWSVNSITVHAS